MGSELHTCGPDEAPREVLALAALLVPQLLAGDDPQLEILRAQYERARVVSVESSGVGIFVSYEVPAELATTVPRDFAGGDARITIAGMAADAGCVLFVRDGHLSFLETFTYDDSWLDDAEVLAVEDVFPLLVPEQ